MKNKKIILRGIPASPGKAEGRVRILPSVEDAEKKFKAGDIIVTHMTDPNWVIYMKKAKAIITNSGGALSHAAIVSRELGIPCIVGTKIATDILKDNMTIIINGEEGIIYETKNSSK